MLSMARRQNVLTKVANVGVGAGLGHLVAGAPGAALGAHLSKERDKRYHGTPWVRAGLGSMGGTAGGLLAGAGLGALLREAIKPGSRGGHLPTLLAVLGAVGGGTAGSVYGARSAQTRHKHRH